MNTRQEIEDRIKLFMTNIRKGLSYDANVVLLANDIEEYGRVKNLAIHSVVSTLKVKKPIGFPAWRKLNKIKKVKGMYTYKGIEQNSHCLWLVYRHETKQDL